LMILHVKSLEDTSATSRHTNASLPLLPSRPGGVHNLLLREDRGETRLYYKLK